MKFFTCWVNLHAFFSFTDKKNFQVYTIRMSISLDPDHAGHFLGPDSALNSLQRLSANDKSSL